MSSKRARTESPEVGLKALLKHTDAWTAVGAFLVAGDAKALNELRRPAICIHAGGCMLSFIEPSSRSGYWLVTHWPLQHASHRVTTEYYKKNSLSLPVFLKDSIRRVVETQRIYAGHGITTRLYFSEARPVDEYARFFTAYEEVCKESVAKGNLLDEADHHRDAKTFCRRCFDEKIPTLEHDYFRWDDFFVVLMQRCFSMQKFDGDCTKKYNATKFRLFCEDFQALLRGDITLKLPCKRLEPLHDHAIEIWANMEKKKEK